MKGRKGHFPLCHSDRCQGERGGSRDQQVEEPPSASRTDVEIPSINLDLGNELHFVKLPRFLRIEPKPFDPQLYEDEFENESMLYEEDRTKLKLKVENTIRWRVRRDNKGLKMKESNARIVRWSDGSMSLHLGSEVFDVYKAPLQDNHNQLFIREDTGLRGQAVFRSKLTFRPHFKDSVAYRKMTQSLVNRTSKTQIRILPMASHDPECQHTEMTKKRACMKTSAQPNFRLQNTHSQPGPSSPPQEPHPEEPAEEEQASVSSSVMRTQKTRLKDYLTQRNSPVKRQATFTQFCNHSVLRN